MPSVTLNKKVFEKLVGRKLPLEKLKDRISYLGTDLEGIKGSEINVEVFPDRPDMLSEQGFARAFSSFIGVQTGLRAYAIEKSGEKLIVEKSVKKVRPYTACAIVKNLVFDDEKIREVVQIQEKLHVTFGRHRKKAAIGIYPGDKIKYPVHFAAKRPEDIVFRPLEFPREINARQILSQHPAGREYGHLLEGLELFPVFIDANGSVLSVPPIINSHLTGKVTEQTTEVFIECSGHDFKVLRKCLNIIVTALADMGGKILSMDLVYPDKRYTSPDLTPEEMKLDPVQVNKLLGLGLTEKDMKKYLERMGYSYSRSTVKIPAYRADILHPCDLAEDIAIAYGFDNIKPEMPRVPTVAQEDPFEKFKARVANILVGLGFLELNTYHITNREFQCDRMNSDLKLVELSNALTAEHNALRAWMTPMLLQVLSENKHHEYPQNIFDIGVVFRKGNAETGVDEAARLCIALCDKGADFTKIKQVLDYLANALDIKYGIEETTHGSFISGRVGRVSYRGQNIAYIGEIHPGVLANWGLVMPVAVLELNLTDLYSQYREPRNI
ncbi:MAG: phenylalanine--tRNA ligase subunit beta [archaeon]